MEKIDEIIDLVEAGSRAQFTNGFRIKNRVIENNGEWTSDLHNQLLDNTTDIAKSLNLLTFALKQFRIEMKAQGIKF